MMKTKLLLMLLAIALVAGAARANMLLNPGFEEGIFGGNNLTPDDWTHYWTSYDATHVWHDDADGAHSGDRYMQVKMWGSGSEAWLMQTVDVTEGQEYAFGVWAKNPAEDQQKEAYAYYEWMEPNEAIISEGWLDPWKPSGDEWGPVDFGSITAPPDASQLRFSLYGALANGLDGILFDDAAIYGPNPPTDADPRNQEFMAPYGDGTTGTEVVLSWTNMAPNFPGDPVYVDVWFGTGPNLSDPNDPNSSYEDFNKVVSADENVTSVTVNAPPPPTGRTAYYWQVGSYISGASHINEPNATEGPLWIFNSLSEWPVSVTIDTPAMITWDDESVDINSTVIDDGASPVTFLWTAEPDNIVTFEPNAFVEDPTVKIIKGFRAEAYIVNPSFEDGLNSWAPPGGGNGTWTGLYDGYVYVTPTDGLWCAYTWAESGAEAGFSQILTKTLATNTTYTLTVDVVNDGWAEDVQYKVQLLAGEKVLAEDDDGYPLTVHGEWQTSTVICTLGGESDPNFAYVGQPLEIRLLAKDGTEEMHFDNVHLTADPGFPVLAGDTYTLTATVEDAISLETDTMTIDIYDDECQMTRIGLSLAAENPGDINADCDTDLYDLDMLVTTWLDEPDGLPTEAIIGLPSSALTIDGLVEYWPFDGDYSATITSAHEGTLKTTGGGSGTFVTGKFGDGIDLENGSSSRASVVVGGEEDDFDFVDGNMSISLWYTTESLYTNWQCMIAKGEGDNWRLARYDDSPTYLNFYGGKSVTGDAELDQQDGSWHHVVVTTDAVNGAKLYIDGRLLDFVAGTITLDTNGQAMQIGGNPDAVGRGWDGILDDVSVWNRTLNADEVSAIWNSGTGADIGSFIITDPTLPTVNAGNDWITWSGEPVVPNASAVNNGVGDLTYAWTADPDAGVVFSATDVIDPTVTITKAASTGGATAVTLTLAVNNEGSGKDPVTDSIVIDVCDDACQAKIAAGQAPPYDPGDVNLDCFTDIKDFAETAETWLEEYTLMEPAPKP